MPIDPVAMTALLISTGSLAATIVMSNRDRQAAATRHIRERWDDLVNLCSSNPEFLDIDFTENYTKNESPARFVYSAYNYKAWTLFDFIASNNLENIPRYNLLMQWIVVHNNVWLDNNPYLFNSDRFWDVYNSIKNEPLTIFRNKTLPMIDGKPSRLPDDRYSDLVDWDKVHSNYHDWIYTPFAPEMVTPDKSRGGKVRNILLEDLWKYPADDLREMRIADYGCGPGNLIPHIAGRVDRIYGVDTSQKALDLAKSSADLHKVEFIPINSNFCSFVPEKKFDLIISVNSILPSSRSDILDAFKSIRSALTPNGRFLAILPAFDAVEALRSYWIERYSSRDKSGNHSAKCMFAFDRSKKFDPENLSYADDGVHIQCFHTPSSISRDFAESGLKLVEGPIKVEYPWDYSKKFDYGYFPDKPEIWDWFVVARRQA